MSKPYIICLKYGTWRNELWFSAPDDEKTSEEWEKAVHSLTAVSAECTNSNDYMREAVKHFEKHGFVRIQH